jgi:hypothetical protein
MGCYLSTYWNLAGHYDDVVRWSIAAMSDNLYPQGRTFAQRTHVHTTFCTYELGISRDVESPMRPEHALDHPFQGLVLEIIDAGDEARRPDLLAWLANELPARRLVGTPLSMCLAFFPTPRPVPSRVPGVTEPPGLTRLVTLLWFLDVDPRQCWPQFLPHGQMIADSGRGDLLLAAPFIPTIPGTNLYVKELR